MKKLLTLAAAAILSLTASAPAMANTRAYSVNALSVSWIDLNVCGQSFSLRVNGDGDTDLDFWVYDPYGNLLHEDTDGTDYTAARFTTGTNGCSTWRLKVANYGRVYNQFSVAVY